MSWDKIKVLSCFGTNIYFLHFIDHIAKKIKNKEIISDIIKTKQSYEFIQMYLIDTAT